MVIAGPRLHQAEQLQLLVVSVADVVAPDMWDRHSLVMLLQIAVPLRLQRMFVIESLSPPLSAREMNLPRRISYQPLRFSTLRLGSSG